MNKDVIYIDVEDDITSIIGKVKASKEKIVALVPPKRVGLLQSAVNLRLIARAAGEGQKRLVIITNNQALSALAAAAQIPIAKTLQSKPELASISALDIDDGEDIIDGSQLPIGEHARTASVPGKAAAAIGTLAIGDAASNLDDIDHANPPIAGAAPQKPRIKSGIKVPNFGSFRKKLILGISGGVLLVGFLVWAIFFAPQAVVTITARTNNASANAKVTISPTATTSFTASSLKAVMQEAKKDVSVEFDPTGTKEVGEKAKGSITIRNCDYDDGLTLPAGTQFTSGGLVFVSTAAVSVPGYSSPSSSTCSLSGSSSGKATVAVEASAVGESYNLSARNYTISSIPAGSKVEAAGTDMAGGSKKQIKIVSASDVQKATDELVRQGSDEIKGQLAAKLNETFIIADQTFKATQSNVQSSPAVDQEVVAGAKGKLTGAVTYTLLGITKADVATFLGEYFANQLKDTKDQRVFSDGSSEATLTNTAPSGDAFTANLVATAKIGPKIDDTEIKNAAKGKRYGEVQSAIEAIQGVDSVDVKFSPFWVTSVPNDTNRIKIDFKLDES
jgi:hypothetical protein